MDVGIGKKENERAGENLSKRREWLQNIPTYLKLLYVVSAVLSYSLSGR